MMITTFIPPKKSLKNLLVNLLLHNGKTTATKLRSQLKGVYSMSNSFQGVNKVLKLLEEENIVYKRNEVWAINKQWMETIKDSLEAYPGNDVTLYSAQMKELTCASVNDALNFVINNVDSGRLMNNGEKLCILHVNNLGFYSLDKNQIKIMNRIAKNNRCVMLIAQKNIVSRTSGTFFKRGGVDVYVDIPKSTPYMIALFGNTVINIFAPKVMDYLKTQYHRIKSMEDIRMYDIYQSIKDERAFTIRMTFETDLEIVESTKKCLLSLVDKKKKL